MMPNPPQQRGNGVARGHLPSKTRPITAPPNNAVFSKKRSRSAEKYYSEDQLRRLHDMINEKKLEALESARSCQETLHGGSIQVYGMHMDFGSEIQEREKAGIISSSVGRFGDALVRSEQMLRNAMSLIERSGKKKIFVSEVIDALGTGKVYGVCECCHSLIPWERMEAVPNATKCVGCKNGSK